MISVLIYLTGFSHPHLIYEVLPWLCTQNHGPSLSVSSLSHFVSWHRTPLFVLYFLTQPIATSLPILLIPSTPYFLSLENLPCSFMSPLMTHYPRSSCLSSQILMISTLPISFYTLLASLFLDFFRLLSCDLPPTLIFTKNSLALPCPGYSDVAPGMGTSFNFSLLKTMKDGSHFYGGKKWILC